MRDRVTGKARQTTLIKGLRQVGTGSGARIGIESQHLESYGASSGETLVGRGRKAKVASTQE